MGKFQLIVEKEGTTCRECPLMGHDEDHFYVCLGLIQYAPEYESYIEWPDNGILPNCPLTLIEEKV